MLSSIHPLGERARNSRWGVTVTFYLLGSVLAGAAFGAVLGLVGVGIDRVVGGAGAWVAGLVVLAGLAGAAVDLGLAGARVPSLIPRQVNDQWLSRYRGWVYGAGFGLQLGVGVATFVTTAAVYATWLVAVLAASPAAGALIGLAFGAARGSVILSMAGVRDRTALRSAHRRIAALASPARSVASAAQAALAVIVGAGVVL